MLIKWLLTLFRREQQQLRDFPQPSITDRLKKLKTKAERKKEKR